MPDTDFRAAAGQRGFTLVEAAVSLFVTTIVLLGVLALFDFSNKLARAQTNIADMQQSLRVAQSEAVGLIRMAGRGGMALGNLPNGWAVTVRNNVPAASHIGANDTPEIVQGSDVLAVRGVFSTPIYQVDSITPGVLTFNLVGGVPVSGTVWVSKTMTTQVPQNLDALKEAIDRRRPEAILLVSPRSAGTWAVVELNPDTSSTTDPDRILLGFTVSGGAHTASYGNFSSSGAGVFPPTLTSVGYLGLLEEHRFYVRRAFAIPNDASSDLAPKLSAARVYPGTETPHDGQAPNWRMDIADNVFDLQVALGVDTAAGGCTLKTDPINCSLLETADGENDDWMFNGEAITNPANFAASDLLYIRLNTLARSDRRDNKYLAPLLSRTEDNRYAASLFNTDTERMFRRRTLRTLIDLRNL
jgi:Tfp pilus assembly protein FimT